MLACIDLRPVWCGPVVHVIIVVMQQSGSVGDADGF